MRRLLTVMAVLVAAAVTGVDSVEACTGDWSRFAVPKPWSHYRPRFEYSFPSKLGFYAFVFTSVLAMLARSAAVAAAACLFGMAGLLASYIFVAGGTAQFLPGRTLGQAFEGWCYIPHNFDMHLIACILAIAGLVLAFHNLKTLHHIFGLKAWNAVADWCGPVEATTDLPKSTTATPDRASNTLTQRGRPNGLDFGRRV